MTNINSFYTPSALYSLTLKKDFYYLLCLTIFLVFNRESLHNIALGTIIYSIIVLYTLIKIKNGLINIFSAIGVHMKMEHLAFFPKIVLPIFLGIQYVYINNIINHALPIKPTELPITQIAATLVFSISGIISISIIKATVICIFAIIKNKDLHKINYILTQYVHISVAIYGVQLVYNNSITTPDSWRTPENTWVYCIILLALIFFMLKTLENGAAISSPRMFKLVLVVIVSAWANVLIYNSLQTPLVSRIAKIDSYNVDTTLVLKLASELDFRKYHTCGLNKNSRYIQSYSNEGTQKPLWTDGVIFMDENLAMKWTGRLKKSNSVDINVSYVSIYENTPLIIHPKNSIIFMDENKNAIFVNLSTLKEINSKELYFFPEFEVDTCVQTSK